MTPVIVVEGVTKAFGSVRALAGIDLEVPAGTVTGLLGPNGAGKTTLVNVLATLHQPDAGRASVAGFDVVSDPVAVRSVIGLAGQYAAVDDVLSGRENLVMVGQLYRLGRREAVRRADETLERLSLSDAADRPVRTYSGGMRRRLDLGASLVGRPQVLILDEPTTGLDPRTRLELWALIEELVEEGTTVLLTTQYLEEADRLADSIVVIDHGTVIARGTADELKDRLHGDVVEVRVSDEAQLSDAVAVLAGLHGDRPTVDADLRQLRVPARNTATTLVQAVRALDAKGIAIDDIALQRPSLDDVFLTLTGSPLPAEETS